MYICRFIFPLVLFPFFIHSQIIFDKPLSPRNANYQISVSLNTKTQTLSGREEIRWINASNSPADEIRLHLYMNAFRSEKSTFLSGISENSASSRIFRLGQPGAIDISRCILKDETDLTGLIEFIRPDDGNEDDSTVIRIPLPKPVPAGGELIMEVAFTCRLPEIVARTGYAHDYFLIAQWFPKIGVYREGEWICHQFFSNSEFFADFGVYEVELTLPREYVTGATGVVTNEKSDDSLKTITWRAEDVHDFAITAWPEFREKIWEIENTSVRLLYAPEHEEQVHRYFQSIFGVMTLLNQTLIPYPYPNLTLVDMPLYGFKSAGMEYPCFITCGSIWNLPDNIRLFPEEVTIHEYTHQYFYGMLASNEVEEPWLDEGFTTFMTARIMDQLYGKHGSFAQVFGIEVSRLGRHRIHYMKNPDLNIILAPSWEFTRREEGIYAYDKPALVLKTFEGYIGSEKMDKILNRYVNKYSFKHPRTSDFIHTAEEIAEQDLDWYFDQALREKVTMDYSVERVSFVESPEQMEEYSVLPEITSETVIRKNGDFIFPLEILCTFSSGNTLRKLWNGRDSSLVLRFDRPDRLISAQLDPDTVMWLDLNWTNNSLTSDENNTAFWRQWLKSLRLYQQGLVGFGSF